MDLKKRYYTLVGVAGEVVAFDAEHLIEQARANLGTARTYLLAAEKCREAALRFLREVEPETTEEQRVAFGEALALRAERKLEKAHRRAKDSLLFLHLYKELVRLKATDILA